MKEARKIRTKGGLTRRHFVKCGAGAVLAASCLPTLQRSAVVFGAADSQAASGKVYICPPCGLPCDKLTFDKPGACPSCGMTLIEKEQADKSPTVSILLFDNVEIIDFAGPWEVFGGAGYKVFTVSEKIDPVNTVYGQKVIADYTFGIPRVAERSANPLCSQRNLLCPFRVHFRVLWTCGVLGYSATTLQQVAVYNTTPDGGRGAIWMSGQGLIGDALGNVYVVIANGTCDAAANCGRNLGESFIKLTPGLVPADWFTPVNRADLDRDDLDVGSGGPMLLPGTSLIAAAGKDGVLRLVNTNGMGGFDQAGDHDVQEFQPPPTHSSVRQFIGPARMVAPRSMYGAGAIG